MKKLHDNKIELKNSIDVIDIYDGEEHHRNNNERTNIALYSTQTVSNDTVTAGHSPSGSFNILT